MRIRDWSSDVCSSDLPDECALLAEALGGAAGRKIEISVPQRGNRKRLLEQAVRNAGEELDRRLAESSSQAKLGRGPADLRSEERSGGKEWASTCRYRRWPYH